MEEILRFLVVRPPSLAPADAAIPLEASADLVQAFRAAAAHASPAHQLATLSAQRRATMGSTTTIPLASTLASWGLAVMDAAIDDASTALASAEAAFGKSATEVLGSEEFKRAVPALADLVTANKYRGFAERDAELAQRAYKAAYLLPRLVQGNAGASPAAVMRKPLVIGIGRGRRPPGRTTPPRDTTQATLDSLTAAIAAQRTAVKELGTLPARALTSARAPDAAKARGAVISRALLEGLTPGTRAALQARGIQEQQPLRTAHAELVAGLRALYEEKYALEAKYQTTSYAISLSGGVFEVTALPLLSGLRLAEAPMTELPTSHSTMSAVGYADLMVVRQQLVRYEGADLSFIENVLIGENKSREHKTSLVTTRTDTNEIETTTEQERDLQSTNRSEMQREAASTMQDQMSMQFGTKVSGSYGPTVQFAVNTDLGFDHSKEQSNKFASTVAQETTQRAATKLTERVKQTTTVTVTSTTEEDNIHGVDNRGRDQHVIGQYQWIDKIYEAQVFNYGNRLLYDFIVPEPAALLVKFSAAPQAGSSIKKPPKFDVAANEIDEGNYTVLALKYGATGIAAPPEPTVTVSKVLEGMDDDADRGVIHQTADLPLPDGYAAVEAALATDFWHNNEDDEHKAKVVILVAGNVVGFNTSKRQDTVALSGEQGTISVAIHTFRTPSVVATVTISCQRTQRALEQWRLEVYSALQQAATAAQRDYEDRVARAKSDAADAAAAAPMRRRTETEIRNELKRLAISMLTHQSFETFDSVQETKDGVNVAFSAAELADPYIRFFEQAFEWEQMTYTFYPYFWGRTSQWKSRTLATDSDPMYLEFLRAGAARLVVPTRKFFEAAVLHFMETGQVWSGGPPPDVTSAECVSIITEIKEATGAPGNEIAVGDPWEVRLPTELVRLRTSAALPSWTKNADGTYTPDEA